MYHLSCVFKLKDTLNNKTKIMCLRSRCDLVVLLLTFELSMLDYKYIKRKAHIDRQEDEEEKGTELSSYTPIEIRL